MRLILRITGTWLIALALVLAVVDGTRSLAANAVEFTSLAELWTQLNPPSLEAVRGFFASRFFADLLDATLDQALDLPAFAVVAIPGIVIALLGRRPRRERYIRAGQF